MYVEESNVYSVCIFFCIFTVDQALNKYIVQIDLAFAQEKSHYIL